MRELEKLDIKFLLLLYSMIVDRSVTKAGSRMGLSEHMAKRVLGMFRTVFNDDLLVKSNDRKFTPTRLATSIAPKLGKAISHHREMARLQSGFDPVEFADTVVIACNDYLAAIGTDLWTAGVGLRAPKAVVNWRPLDTPAVEMLVTGGVDFVLFVLAPYAAQPNMPDTTLIRDMVVKPLMDDEFVVFGRREHSLFGRAPIDIKQFAACEHILVSPSGAGPGVVDLELARLGLTRRIRSRSWSFLLAADMALRTNSIATIPKRLAQRYAGGVFRPLPLKLPSLPCFIAWHISRNTDMAHTWLRRRLIEQMQGKRRSLGSDQAITDGMRKPAEVTKTHANS